MREPEYQKKIANKAKPIARKAVNYTIDALSGDSLNKASNKLRPKEMIPGNMVKGGKGVDIHKAILKVTPEKGFVMPGHKYTDPGNPL